MKTFPAANPYSGDELGVALLQSWVVYADILGWKAAAIEQINLDGGQPFLARTQTSLSKALNELRAAAQRNPWPDPDTPWRYAVKTFTDNLVIGVPWSLDRDDGEHELGLTLDQASTLQLQLACDGFFLRGGFAAGAHYMDEDFVFGAALVESVNADAPGGPPAIVATESAKCAIRRHLSYYRSDTHRPHDRNVWVDAATEQWFVNYLDPVLWAWPSGSPFIDELRAHRDAIVAGLATHRHDEKTRKKYEWLATYHNEFCAAFGEENRPRFEFGEIGYEGEFYPDFDPELEFQLEAINTVVDLQIPGFGRLVRGILV